MMDKRQDNAIMFHSCSITGWSPLVQTDWAHGLLQDACSQGVSAQQQQAGMRDLAVSQQTTDRRTDKHSATYHMQAKSNAQTHTKMNTHSYVLHVQQVKARVGVEVYHLPALAGRPWVAVTGGP